MQAHAPGTHDVQSGGRKRLSTTEFGPSKTFDVVCRRLFGPSKTFDDDDLVNRVIKSHVCIAVADRH